MEKLKLISKSGLFLGFAIILLVAILDSSLPGGKVLYEGKKTITYSMISDILFMVSIVLLVISMFLRILTRRTTWRGLVRFSEFFVPLGVVSYFVAAYLSEGRVGLLGIPSPESPQYWVGIALIALYGLGMLYFSLRTFYQKW